MYKAIFASAATAAALALAGCGGAEENNMAVENIEELNSMDDMNMGMDMNADMNMDMNMTDTNLTDANMVDNSTVNGY